MYATGVVLWEVLARRVRIAKYANWKGECFEQRADILQNACVQLNGGLVVSSSSSSSSFFFLRFRGTATPMPTLRTACAAGSAFPTSYVTVVSSASRGSLGSCTACSQWGEPRRDGMRADCGLQEIDGQDKIVMLINDIIVSLLQPAAERRPSAAATNRKFAKFIRDIMEADDETY